MANSWSIAEYAGPNSTQVQFGKLTLWFSYQTLIGFQVAGEDRVVRVNRWGTATGKHCNKLLSKELHLPDEEFERRVDEQIKKTGLGW